MMIDFEIQFPPSSSNSSSFQFDIAQFCVNGCKKMAMIKLTILMLNTHCKSLNPLTAKLFNLNFHPLEAVSR